jgi:hypothetical protein
LRGLLALCTLLFTLLVTEPLEAARPLNAALDQVQRIEILYFPEWIDVRTGLTPERLEQTYQYKLEIREVRESREWQRLSSALRETSVDVTSRDYDHRIAVLLFDHDDKRLSSLYFDQSGKGGTVNGSSGTIKGGLYRWTKSMLRSVGE